MADMVPAAAVKAAVALPEATVTDVGTVSAEALSETATAVAAVVVAERVTVQELEAPEAKVVGLHTSEETVSGGAVRLMEAVLELPFNAAVTTAV